MNQKTLIVLVTSLLSSSVLADIQFTVYNSTDCPSGGTIPHIVNQGCTPISEGFWSISVQYGLAPPTSACIATVFTDECSGDKLASLTENDTCYNLDAAAKSVAYNC
ncbi:hypothetical protein BGW36DRAFT_354058 [Talaromyces proteolyticus]|uniref:Secreted protein n=1 Tax=Talaromyces proteolyticus TaxID=1131652 RepID=A0AAD4L304_9EURO|nr:uncharacterized protein BGW36DRAFT_354058 [Talaromyces proteolyticus]KAH8705660.1 hypothetical protein BGW36DRAFT_354058 [Talaromyces proteolyticus]